MHHIPKIIYSESGLFWYRQKVFNELDIDGDGYITVNWWNVRRTQETWSTQCYSAVCKTPKKLLQARIWEI